MSLMPRRGSAGALRRLAAAAAPATQDRRPSGSAQDVYTIGMSQCNLGEPWRVQMNADIKAAADKHANLKVVFKDAQNDTLKQRPHVEEFVSAGVDLIIISPKEAAPLTEPVAKAVDAGIPVIVLDRAVLGDQYTCFIGADNKKIGKAAGAVDRQEARRQGQGGRAEGPDDLHAGPGPPQRLPRGHRRQRHRGDLRGRHEVARARRAQGNGVGPGPLRQDRPGLRPQRSRRPRRLPGRQGRRPREGHRCSSASTPCRRKASPTSRQGILDATFQYPTGGAEAIDTALKILSGEEVPKKITLGSRVFTKDNSQRRAASHYDRAAASRPLKRRTSQEPQDRESFRAALSLPPRSRERLFRRRRDGHARSPALAALGGYNWRTPALRRFGQTRAFRQTPDETSTRRRGAGAAPVWA